MRDWLKEAERINWKIKPKIILKKQKNNHEWFYDGKLNVYESCITRFLTAKKKKKTAIIFYDLKGKIKHYNYKQIDNIVNKAEYLLKKKYKISSKNKIIIHGSATFETINFDVNFFKIRSPFFSNI